MLLKFEKTIADFIKADTLLAPADNILLAVSGGADSTAMLYTMLKLKAEGIFAGRLICAHINHKLRDAQSDADEKFVIAQAEKLNLSVITERVDVRGHAREKKLSIETAARELRIKGLLNIARANKCSTIATAHHSDDNAETIIQRLARGTGFRGLRGIQPMRNFTDDIKFVRPMLRVTRDDIIEYLKKRNLKWREDQSNADCRYRRNFIRHRLLPELQKQCSQPLTRQLSTLARSAGKFYDLICAETNKAWAGVAEIDGQRITLDTNVLSELPAAVKVELIRRSLVRLGSGEQNLSQQHFEKILQLANQKRSGKKIELPGEFIACFEYGKLIFSKDMQTNKEKSTSVEMNIPGQTRFADLLIEAELTDIQNTDIEQFKADKTIEFFDFDKIKLPLIVRLRKDGDRFIPFGRTEPKKIGKFLTAQRVPKRIRDKALIIEDAEKILWLWPIRISEQAKITNETKKVLRLKITDTALDS